jgi:AAHS family 4-hydroxybenzoate transporter-like MFS transporter
MKIQVSEVIDRNALSRLQLKVIILCGLVTLLDGLDIQAMSVAAPQISAEWGVKASVLGPVLSATFAGITAGAMLFGILGDRIGRRKVLLGSFALVGAMALLTAFAQTPTHLLILRFLTGLGIGGALPNATALTAEYAPARKRILLITLMYTGVPLGSSMVAFLAPSLIEAFSWRAIFVVGGVVPLALSVLLAFNLPESVRFLAGHRKGHRQVGDILGKIDPGYRYDESHEFHVESEAKGNSVRKLFTEGRVAVTLPLWLVFFSSFFGFYIITSWLPVIFTNANWPRAAALSTIAAFQMGVVFGGLLCGWFVDRSRAFLVLALFYLTGGLIVTAIGAFQGGLEMTATMALVVLAGASFGGAQVCIVAVAASVYPTSVRATGVGWALGAGRTGAVVSPTVAGFAIAAHWNTQEVMMLAAVPAVVCAALSFGLLAHERVRAARAAALAAPEPSL